MMRQTFGNLLCFVFDLKVNAFLIEMNHKKRDNIVLYFVFDFIQLKNLFIKKSVNEFFSVVK